jgi:phosphoserine phosphatase
MNERAEGTTPHQSIDAILARLDAALADAPRGVIATDADNTLWDGDVGDDLYDALLAAGGVREEAREALAAEARAFGLPDEGDANHLAEVLLEGFKAKRYPADRNYAMVAWIFAGWHVDELRAFCARVLEEGRVEARIRPEMRAVRRWAEARGVPFYIVSASPIAIVRAGVTRLDVAPEKVAAMDPAIGPDGRLLPRLDGPVVYGDGKLHALERILPNATLLGAFGDSTYDAPLLRASRVPVAVTPSAGLVELLPTIPGVVVLAR